MTQTAQSEGATSPMPVPSYPDLAGKVAVVTGGSGGIGSATCRLLAANGAKVVVNARDQAAIEAVVGAIRSDGGEAIGVSADCKDAGAVEHMRQRAEAELGPVEILAAFVGSGGARVAPTEQTTEEDWRLFVDGSLTATFLTVKSFLPGMIERRRGAIITMSSTAGRVPLPGPSAAYASAKAGVVMYTRYLAMEGGKYGVRANCISPGTVLVERLAQLIPVERQQQMAAMTVLGRLGTPDDVALAALFLASDSSSWITGATLDVNGGAVML
ncbi:MAG: SDR family NAD(P)-dependent oxidoreductase [Dehalococcoidia bacterium]